MGNEDSTPSIDARLEVLAHPERRRLIAELLAAEPDAEVSVVAGSDADADADSLRIAMHHVHVPKLVGQGIAERGQMPQHVRRGPAFDAVIPLLQTATEHADTTVVRRA